MKDCGVGGYPRASTREGESVLPRTMLLEEVAHAQSLHIRREVIKQITREADLWPPLASFFVQASAQTTPSLWPGALHFPVFFHLAPARTARCSGAPLGLAASAVEGWMPPCHLCDLLPPPPARTPVRAHGRAHAAHSLEKSCAFVV